MDSIESRVIRGVAAQLGVAEEYVSPSSVFTIDLDVDSLDFVELVKVLEDELKIKIPIEDVREIKTVQDLVDYVREQSKA